MCEVVISFPLYKYPPLSLLFSLTHFLLSMEDPQHPKRRFRRTRNPETTPMELQEEEEERGDNTTSFCINDHADVLVEVLKRLDARSLGVAACVCSLWSSLARNDAVWEHLCFRHSTPPPSPSARSLVVSLGGYRRLYMLCVHPALSSLQYRADADLTRRVWSRHGAQLSLSLFCVDYYERLGVGGAPSRSDASTSSLIFLCKPVNV